MFPFRFSVALLPATENYEAYVFEGRGAQDGRVDFHTAPELCYCCTYTYIGRYADVVIRALTVYVLSMTVCRSAVNIIHAGTFGLMIEPHRFHTVNRRYSSCYFISCFCC